MFKDGDVITLDYNEFYKLEGPIKNEILNRYSKRHFIIRKYNDGILLNELNKPVKITEETAYTTFGKSYILNTAMINYIKYFVMQEKIKDFMNTNGNNESLVTRVTKKIKSICR
jgi:hypothetical protein